MNDEFSRVPDPMWEETVSRIQGDWGQLSEGVAAEWEALAADSESWFSRQMELQYLNHWMGL